MPIIRIIDHMSQLIIKKTTLVLTTFEWPTIIGYKYIEKYEDKGGTRTFYARKILKNTKITPCHRPKVKYSSL